MNDLNPELFTAEDFVRYFTPTSRLEELMLNAIKDNVEKYENYWRSGTTMEDLENQIIEIENRLAREHDDNSDLCNEIDDLNTQINSLERDNDSLEDQVTRLEEDNSDLHDLVDDLRGRISDLERDIEVLNDLVIELEGK